MNYSLRTVGTDGLSENVLIGHNVKYMGRKHPDFQKFKESAKIGETTDNDFCGIFLHPYGVTGYTLVYSHSDYYIVMPNGETFHSYRFAYYEPKGNPCSLQNEESNLNGKRVLLIGGNFGTIIQPCEIEGDGVDTVSHPWHNGFAVKTDDGLIVATDEIDENSSHEQIHLLEWIQNEGWDTHTEEGIYCLNGEDYTLAGMYERYLER